MFVLLLLLRPPPLGILQLDHSLPGLGRDAAGSEERTRFPSLFLHKSVTFKLIPSQEERFLGVQVLLLVARRRLLRPAAGAAVVGRP